MSLKSSQANLNQVKSALFGVAIGDALGVPVEFNGRMLLKNDPVVDFATTVPMLYRPVLGQTIPRYHFALQNR